MTGREQVEGTGDRLLGLKHVADLLGVTSNQAYMWHQRRDRNGFPEAIASSITGIYPGGKKRAPLFDPDAVVQWFMTYDSRRNQGRHWDEKRKGAPPKNRGRDIQRAWRERKKAG